MLPLQVHLTLPPWIGEVADESRVYLTDEERVGLAIELSKHNVERSHGGPFGAAVFNAAGRLISVGVNRVVPQSCSIAHAEMMAFMTAQQRLMTFRLNEQGGHYILATSAQPCCQCFGATIWAVQMLWIPITAAGIINGIGHYWGYRNFEAADASRNIMPWGIIIGGEELHNNHHTYPTSAKLSVKPYEFDIGWAYIRGLEMMGLAKVRKTPRAQLGVSGRWPTTTLKPSSPTATR